MSTMSFRVTIQIDNAAFVPDPVPEVACIIREIAWNLEHGGNFTKPRVLVDTNGNVVGQAAFVLLKE